MPLLVERLRPNQNQNNRQVQRNVAASVSDAQQASSRALIFHSLCFAAEAMATTIILLLHWNDSCDKPLNWWVLSFTSRLLLVYPLQIRTFVRRRRGLSVANENRLRAWLDLLIIIGFVIGQTFVFGSTSCSKTAPSLFTYCFVLVVLFYISIAFPYLLLIALCVCFPCVLLFLRLVSEPVGAPVDVIQNLPSRIYEPSGPQDLGSHNDSEPSRPQQPNRAEDSPSCSVCMENYLAGDHIRILPCNHEYHSKCVDNWLKINSTCPLCRQPCTSPAVSGVSNRQRSDRLQDPHHDLMARI